MLKIVTLSLIAANFLLANEPSAFSAGGKAPQKTEAQVVNERLFNLSTELKNVQESQEGLKSVFEGQIQRIQENANKLELMRGENDAAILEVRRHVDTNFALQNENIEKIKQSISALGALIKKTNASMQSEIDSLKSEIATLKKGEVAEAPKAQETKDSKETEVTKEADLAVDSALSAINETKSVETTDSKEKELDAKNIANAVVVDTKEQNTEAKKEEAKDSKQVESQEAKEIKETKETKEPKESKETKEAQKTEVKAESKKQDSKEETKKDLEKSLKNKKSATILKEADSAFKNKDYETSEAYFQHLVKENYKPAKGNYMLGEIAFAQNRYEDAIYYYKTSATRFDKADYMPNLMLNSAKSFLALKEKENANRFLETLITLYPKSNEAKEAKKLLK